jgi:Family of unknown function (DUF6221)
VNLPDFLRARLAEDNDIATRAAWSDKVRLPGEDRGLKPGDWSWLADYGQPQLGDIPLIDHQVRFDPAAVGRRVAAGRELLAAYEQALDCPYDLPAGAQDGRGPDERARDVGVLEVLHDLALAEAMIWCGHREYTPDLWGLEAVIACWQREALERRAAAAGLTQLSEELGLYGGSPGG